MRILLSVLLTFILRLHALRGVSGDPELCHPQRLPTVGHTDAIGQFLFHDNILIEAARGAIEDIGQHREGERPLRISVIGRHVIELMGF